MPLLAEPTQSLICYRTLHPVAQFDEVLRHDGQITRTKPRIWSVDYRLMVFYCGDRVSELWLRWVAMDAGGAWRYQDYGSFKWHKYMDLVWGRVCGRWVRIGMGRVDHRQSWNFLLSHRNLKIAPQLEGVAPQLLKWGQFCTSEEMLRTGCI